MQTMRIGLRYACDSLSFADSNCQLYRWTRRGAILAEIRITLFLSRVLTLRSSNKTKHAWYLLSPNKTMKHSKRSLRKQSLHPLPPRLRSDHAQILLKS